MKLSIRGLQEAQRANLKLISAVRPGGALGRAVLYMATEAERYAVSYTHVDTGALRASHRIRQETSTRYRIYIDPSATNPRSKTPTSKYGPIEHRRGGDHEFYGRTYRQGPQIASRAIVYLRSQLP
jgi:hypothetical protein